MPSHRSHNPFREMLEQESVVRLVKSRRSRRWGGFLVIAFVLVVLGSMAAAVALHQHRQAALPNNPTSQQEPASPRSNPPPKKTTSQQEPTSPRSNPPTKIARREQSPPPLPRQTEAPEAPKAPDRQWVHEARLQYLEALKNKERRLSIQAQRIGLLNPAERQLGLAACKMLKEKGIENIPPNFVSAASKVAPDYVRKLQKDAFAKLRIREGEKIDWWPPTRRKKRYEDFAEHLGLKSEWSLAHPFDDLSPTQIEAAITAAIKAKSGGLAALDWGERQLLLDAGALEFFERYLKGAD